MNTGPVFRFDAFELDCAKRELRRGGEVVPVEPQVFALLHLLVENRDRAVSKDEIIERVWSGRIVSDSALSSRIKSLRRALGDDGDAQKYLQTLRGFGFRFVGTVESGAAPAAALASQVAQVMARPLIAVFPMQQALAGPEDAYFAEGIADSLIAELSAWRWFPVLSRNASFASAGADLPLTARAAELGARYAVGGRIVRLGARARLTIELCDVESGVQLWSRTIERERAALLAMQGEIARDLVRRITPELDAAERRRILRQPPRNESAWDMTLRALWLLNHPDRDSFAKAIEQLDGAARLDPGAAMPRSLRALARFEAGLKNWVDGKRADAAAQFRAMHGDARRAIELDPNGWMGHALVAIAQLWGGAGSYDEARFHADEAVSLNPSAGLAQHLSGCVLGFGGDLDEATAIQNGIFRVDPLYRQRDGVEADLGLWAFLRGDLDAARTHLDRALAAAPHNVRARQRLAAVLSAAGELDAARAEIEQLEALGAPLTRAYVEASYPFQRPEHARLFRRALARAGVEFEE
jgi:DNA-binding winged helix-turn-helix (wHTH) protein/Flp pilus assembly protein TadD